MQPNDSPRLASWALERIAARLGVPIWKALDPLDPEDFITISVRLATALRGSAKGAEASALKDAIETLDVDWPKLTSAARGKVVEAARAEVLRMSSAVKAVSEVFDTSASSIVVRTRGSVVRRYGLDVIAEPTKADQNIADLLRRSQMVYVKDEFGRRADAFDRQAKEIVAHGLERGLGRDDISGELATQLKESQVNRASNYWDLVANDFANKSRTTTQIGVFDEAGITEYRFEAVMDEVTSSICRMLHGTTWSVPVVREQLASALELDDPEDIRDARPWVRNGREDGKEVLFFERGGERHIVAEVLRSGVGTRDASGSFRREMSDADLQAAGCTVPPLHGRCRSTIVAA